MNHLFVDNLTVIDFSYYHNQRGILGESWIVDIELGGELDAQGMVFDFGHVKKQIKRLIDDLVDHRFVIPSQIKDIDISQVKGVTTATWLGTGGHYRHTSPDSAVLFIDTKSINKTVIARHLEENIKPTLPANVCSVKVTLREEAIDGAYYHYSHGLKKHDGNCQRIVHGHRSRIEIYENHQRNIELEELWAAKFRNIYIATEEDLIDKLDIDGRPHLIFGYKANQGSFELQIPAKKVYQMGSDTTVELIAAHIADQCSLQFPANHYRIKAFEGVGKGAIASRTQKSGT